MGLGENGGLITNNQDLFSFFSPILSRENRTCEYVHAFFLVLHNTDIFSENRISDDVKTFFALPISVIKYPRGSHCLNPVHKSIFKGGAIVPCSLLTLPLSKKEQHYWCQMTNICHNLLVVSVAYGQGRIQRGRMRDMHPPNSHFQKCFASSQQPFSKMFLMHTIFL